MNVIDLSKLQHVRHQGDGIIQCSCPACAEQGQNITSHDHLRVWPDLSFNCIVDGSKEHRDRILQLVGTEATEETRTFIPSFKPVIIKTYPDSILSQLAPDYSYWVGRGISEATMRRFECGLAPEGPGKLSGRFVFAARDAHKKIVGFSGRWLKDIPVDPATKKPKIKRWKHIGPSSLFLMNHVSHPAILASREVILVEGIGCCLALCNVGICQVLPLFGLQVSSTIICYLASLSLDRIIVATNNEPSGIGNKAAEKLKAVLDRYFDNVIIHLPPVKDFLDCEHSQRESWAAQIGAKRA